MKANIITLLLLSAICLNANAQDDDMYSFSTKKKAQQTTTTTSARSSSSAYFDEGDADADYHTGQLRDVDEYNRRYSKTQGGTASYQMKGDTLYVTTEPSQDYNEGYSDGYYDGLYDSDFTYTTRLARYRGFCLSDPYYWDYYGWYDPWYSWHSPYYYGYIGWNGWGLGWGWSYPYYSGWYYGWNYPHHYGGHYGGGHHWDYTRRQSSASHNLGPRSSAYSGRNGGNSRL